MAVTVVVEAVVADFGGSGVAGRAIVVAVVGAGAARHQFGEQVAVGGPQTLRHGGATVVVAVGIYVPSLAGELVGIVVVTIALIDRKVVAVVVGIDHAPIHYEHHFFRPVVVGDGVAGRQSQVGKIVCARTGVGDEVVAAVGRTLCGGHVQGAAREHEIARDVKRILLHRRTSHDLHVQNGVGKIAHDVHRARRKAGREMTRIGHGCAVFERPVAFHSAGIGKRPHLQSPRGDRERAAHMVVKGALKTWVTAHHIAQSRAVHIERAIVFKEKVGINAVYILVPGAVVDNRRVGAAPIVAIHTCARYHVDSAIVDHAVPNERIAVWIDAGQIHRRARRDDQRRPDTLKTRIHDIGERTVDGDSGAIQPAAVRIGCIVLNRNGLVELHVVVRVLH